MGLLLLLFCTQPTQAQIAKFVAVDAGLNGFFGTEAADRVGTTFQIGFGVHIGEEDEIQFLTKLNVGNNRYKSQLTQSSQLLIDQRVLDLSAKVAVPVARGKSFYLGLFSSIAFKGQTSESERSMFSVINIPVTSTNYSNQFQSGLSVGAMATLGKHKRGFLDLQVRQNVTELFSSDVDWEYFQGTNVVAFNNGAKPTTLILGLGIFL